MGSSELRWSRYRSILLSLAVFFLNPIMGNDFKEIYRLERINCHKNPQNYLENGTSLIKCNVSFAGACWPETPAGSTFIQPCPTLFFSSGGFIHRRCNTSGNWERMNITQCRRLQVSQVFKKGEQLSCELKNTACPPSNSDAIVELKQQYLNEGYVFIAFSWVSVSIMLPSLLILMVCNKDTDQKDRFSLHKNLLVAFLMRTLTYVIDYYGGLTMSDSLQRVCTGVWVFNRYFATAEVTWMTNEAIFLLRLLVRAFDNDSYYWHYFCFGWGLPAVLTFIIYIPASLVIYGASDPRCWSVHGQEPVMMYLYGPMTLMLVINLVIMFFALYTLVRKMKGTSTPELQIARKATKGALILIPQMGVIYLVIFYTPRGNKAFDYFVRVAFPLQGALAALVFVAWNSDVRQAVKQRWQQWCYQNNLTKKSSRSSQSSRSSTEEQAPGRLTKRITFHDCLITKCTASEKTFSRSGSVTGTTTLNTGKFISMS
ncbi:Corticotropin-releasing factor receptor 1 [Desmophyllum pertusum]|uniref:Corticotropin-releasing factor receptor 1 n=1 Tax=Desmophyllum pertusum TaxID=174260 RepID=A0A9X0A2H7_9CNID|nr:Corticotropin-releasing factor receptor 1 [Desmophyllum pertusum]